ncbi:hypothetical protein PMAYCL1PPCAC_10182, partial [Pristionchus mayeri]
SDRTSFTLNIRLSAKAASLHPALKDLHRRIVSIRREREDEGRLQQMVCISIPVRNRKDAVIEYISNAISPVVKEVSVQNLRSLEELKF